MRVRNTKTISTSLCALALLGALCAPARAVVDPLYVGDVDAVTGEAVTRCTMTARRAASSTP